MMPGSLLAYSRFHHLELDQVLKTNKMTFRFPHPACFQRERRNKTPNFSNRTVSFPQTVAFPSNHDKSNSQNNAGGSCEGLQ